MELSRNLTARGFTTLRAEQLTLQDRLQTFRDARCVVLPLGAGLANLAYRIGKPAGIVEIFPADRDSAAVRRVVQPRVRLLLPAVVGTPLSHRGSFSVDVATVIHAVDEVLAELPTESRAESASAPVPDIARALEHLPHVAVPGR